MKTALAIPVVLLLTLVGSDGAPIGWTQADGYRSAPVAVPSATSLGFRRHAPSESGITFVNRLSDTTVSTNRLYEIGSGVTLGDVDGDGRVDIYLCGLENGNALYRNLGDWRFEDITARAGVGCAGQFSIGCALVDLDGSGDLDLLVSSLGGGVRAFHNNGHGEFTEIADSGLFRELGATSMAFGDIDGDGDLDLYVANYRTDTFFDSPPGLRMEMRPQPDGTRAVEPRDRFLTVYSAAGIPTVLERGEPDVLYLNRGHGHFLAVPWNTGLFLDAEGRPLKGPPTEWGLCAMFRDLNGDGTPDLYVCNDFVNWQDRLWFNEGGRRFRAAATDALRAVSVASMAVDAADMNRDGIDDLFVVDMLHPLRKIRAWQRPDLLQGVIRWPIEDSAFCPEVPRNTLQLGRGDGTFAEIAVLAGVAATDWTPAALFLDVDLDGWEDLLLSAGNLHDVQDVDALAAGGRAPGVSTPPARLQRLANLTARRAPSLAFRNRHDLTFEDKSVAWDFHYPGFSHGMALGDLDNDGDLDVVINCMNEPARLLENLATAPRIAVRLRGRGDNTRGIGARITVSGGPVVQTQEMMAGGRYASSDDAMRVFAAGTATNLTLDVRWRSGLKSTVPRALPNHLYEIQEPGGPPGSSATPARTAPLFTEVPLPGNLDPGDAPYDDFARQPLLPRRLGDLGPGIAWIDLDNDGQDELVAGGGREGRAILLRMDANGAWTQGTLPGLEGPNPRDQTSVVLWRDASGRPRLLMGESNWEDADSRAPSFRQLPLRHASHEPALTPSLSHPMGEGARRAGEGSAFAVGSSSVGPLAIADMDGDGDLDLFVGSRTVPGRYPEASRSWIVLSGPSGFLPPTPLPADPALVSGAVFTDIDGDGDPDLALACDWGPIRLFRNDAGVLTEITAQAGLEPFRGWWNGIASGDFDGDGRLDLVASNWGRNWRSDCPTGPAVPVEIYFGDFAGTGTVLTLLASLDPALGKVTPWRDRSAIVAAMPEVGVRFPTHHAFAEAGILDILDERASSARHLQAGTFDSMLFLNRRDHFEARPLPVEAQFAPAFGVSVGDLDGDGHEDLFLAQNFFGMDPEGFRQAAGMGLVLIGDGTGNFRALRPGEAGIRLPGEQRGSALADFDHDGRLDLAVSQHGGPLHMLRNVRGRPGVTIHLRGAGSNPDAIGAAVRMVFDSGYGPIREIHEGTGYGSDDSKTLVFGTPMPAGAVQVRWPGGRTQDWRWPSGATVVQISAAGISKVK